MSKNSCRMAGLIIMMISVFFLIAGLFLKGDSVPAIAAPVCLAAGILLLIVGTIFYKILHG